MTVVVSILGLGRWDQNLKKYIYDNARYAWGNREIVETSLIQDAYLRWFPEASFLILATEKAEEERKGDLERIPNKRIVRIKEGKNTDEFWQIYNVLADNLEPDSEVILDITHGFRSLGMLAFLATAFLRAAKQIKLTHLLYGAFEAKSEEGVTPIFDLAPFVTMLDWASATSRFLDTGYAQKLAQIAGSENKFRTLAVSLTDFSHAIQLHDPVRVGLEARRALDAMREGFSGPMEVLRGQLQLRLEPLVFTKEDEDKKQLISILAQVDWYLEHQHYEKAVGLAKEWLYLFARWKSKKGIWPNGEKFSLNAFLSNIENKRLQGIYNELKVLRDGLLHWRGIPTEEGGNAEDQSTFDSQIARIQDVLKRLKSEVIQMGLELPEVS